MVVAQEHPAEPRLPLRARRTTSWASTPRRSPRCSSPPGDRVDGAHHRAARGQRADPAAAAPTTAPTSGTWADGSGRHGGGPDGGAGDEPDDRVQGLGRAVRAARAASTCTVLAEQAGFDSVFVSDHFQPWRHDGGHAPAALPWLGAAGARTERVVARHVGPHADLPLSPRRGRPGVRDPRGDVPWPDHPRRRHRGVAQRGPARPRVARRQGAVRPPQGGASRSSAGCGPRSG